MNISSVLPTLGRMLSPRKRVTRGVILVLLISILATGVRLLYQAPSVYAQRQQSSSTTVRMLTQSGATPRLETFRSRPVGVGGVFVHRWSDDGGITWSAWVDLPPPPNGVFFGSPAVASDGVGRLTVVGWEAFGTLLSNTYNNGSWSGWSEIPTSTCLNVNSDGGICISSYLIIADIYYFDTAPVLTSWGAGRMELFIGSMRGDGIGKYGDQEILLHTWADNYTWSGDWETLGVGNSKPAAVSWGPGRTDVFMKGEDGTLLHKWFDNGQWHSSWENLGGSITSAPTVASWGPGRLDVFARGTDGHLWHLPYGSGWEDLGCCLLDTTTVVGGPAATSRGLSLLDVFVIGTDHNLYHKVYDNGWSAWINDNSPASYIAAVTWVAVAPPPPDTPTPTPSPRCGRAGQPPCPRDP